MVAGMGLMIGLMAVTGFILSREPVAKAAIGIFSSDSDVIAYGARFLAIMSVMSWSNGIYDASKGYLNGLGKTVSTVTINAARLWVFRFAVLFVCESILQIGVDSIWYAVTPFKRYCRRCYGSNGFIGNKSPRKRKGNLCRSFQEKTCGMREVIEKRH